MRVSKKPKFLRQGAKAYKRLGMKWRRPKGIHSKLRKGLKSKGKKPSIGYRTPKTLRGLHPSGYREVLIQNLNDLEKIDVKKEAVRISRKVGKKLKMKILEMAKELKIKVLNP